MNDALDGAGDEALAAIRACLANVPGESHERLDAVVAEAVPFVDAAHRAAREPSPRESAGWRETRSLAWLFAYRLGDQGWSPALCAAVVHAWRDGGDGAGWRVPACDELMALALEAYARGAADRLRAEQQQALGNALAVEMTDARVLLVVAAGPLEPDGARRLVERTSAALLRRDPRGVVLDLAGLVSPTHAVLTELWTIPQAARMLGVRCAVSAGDVLRGVDLPAADELRCESLADGCRVLAASRWQTWLAAVARRRGR